MRIPNPARKSEHGVTILIVGLTLLVLMAMAALAIDVANLYELRNEAQRAADAAALAGAKMFVTSSYTSTNALSFSDICQSGAGGLTAAVNKQAEAAVLVNRIGGQPATIKKIDCFNNNPLNPRVSVTVQSGDSPAYFSRVFGLASNTITATAVAEAYNASGRSLPIAVTNVKPWFIPNCDPGGGDGPCGNGYFINPADGTIKNNGAFVGQTLHLNRQPSNNVGGDNSHNGMNGVLQFYGLDYIDGPAPSCPSSGATSCGNPINRGDTYIDNIACSSSLTMYCGQLVGPGTNPRILIHVESNPLTTQPTIDGTKCLIHAQDNGPNQGQDEFTSGVPVTINGGSRNPNPSLRVPNISRSDSVVSAMLFDGREMCFDSTSVNGSCVHGPSSPAPVIGFIQLGIKQAGSTGGTAQTIDGVIMNVIGCSPDAIAAYGSATAITGGGASPIPVRLVRTP